MSRPDAIAAAALDAQVIRPVFFAYLDIVGDPLRACTAGKSMTVTGSGDPELDGFIFDGINPVFVDVGAVRQLEGGSESVTARLSGIPELDGELLAIVGDRANWQGRVGRLWMMVRDEYGTQKGGLTPYYTGWMTSLRIKPTPGNQVIELTLEGYAAAYSQPSYRTYLDQESFDPGDLSARAAIALANGVSSNPLVANTPTSAAALVSELYG